MAYPLGASALIVGACPLHKLLASECLITAEFCFSALRLWEEVVSFRTIVILIIDFFIAKYCELLP